MYLFRVDRSPIERSSADAGPSSSPSRGWRSVRAAVAAAIAVLMGVCLAGVDPARSADLFLPPPAPMPQPLPQPVGQPCCFQPPPPPCCYQPPAPCCFQPPPPPCCYQPPCCFQQQAFPFVERHFVAYSERAFAAYPVPVPVGYPGGPFPGPGGPFPGFPPRPPIPVPYGGDYGGPGPQW
jgi:hypothetical protein